MYVHQGIFTPSRCQQLNVPSGEMGTFSPPWWGKEPGSASSPKGNCTYLRTPSFFKGELRPELIQERSLLCSCHPVAFRAMPGPLCAQSPSHLLQSNIPPPSPAPWVPGQDLLLSCVMVEAQQSLWTPQLNPKALQGWV